MFLQSDIKFQVRLMRWWKYFVWTITFTAISVLLGWQFNIGILKRPLVFVLAVIIVFFIALWYNTILLNKRDLQKSETEKALKESQEQVQAIFRGAPDAVIVIDEEGKIIQWNKQAELLFGWTAQEVCFKPLSDFIIPHQYREQHRQGMQRFIKTGKSGILDNNTIELKAIKKDSSEIDVSLSISPTMLKEKYLFVGFIRDITEKRKTEEQLRQFNKLLEEQVKEKTAEITGIFERITDGFIELDKNFCYTYINKKTAELIRRDPQSLIGKCVWDIFPDVVGTETYKAFRKAMAEQCYIIHTDYYEPLNLWQENHIYPSPEGLSIFIRDISKKRNAEELLKQSYEDIRRLASHQEKIREEERTSIAREIHDELGQQLTVLKMDISWLNKNSSQDEEKIKQRITGLLQMIDNTIRTVRRISSELRPSILDDLGLLAALEWLSSDFEKKSGIKTTFITDVSELNLDTSINTAMFRIFQESLTNVARHAQASEVFALLKIENDELLIRIKDNGNGFIMSGIENKKTLGILGMKERVALIKGEYKIDSSPGKGTTVEVRVPVSSETEPKTSV
jgi:PAS domain S-box-containing protein